MVAAASSDFRARDSGPRAKRSAAKQLLHWRLRTLSGSIVTPSRVHGYAFACNVTNRRYTVGGNGSAPGGVAFSRCDCAARCEARTLRQAPGGITLPESLARPSGSRCGGASQEPIAPWAKKTWQHQLKRSATSSGQSASIPRTAAKKDGRSSAARSIAREVGYGSQYRDTC